MILNYFKKNFLINLILIFLIFSLDRISKIYIIYLNKKYYDSAIFKSKYLNIDLMWNEGIAFGLLSFNRTDLYNFLTIIISVVILVIFIMVIKNIGLKKYSLIMILGGAIGNLYDRVFYRAVPDFIDFHIGEFHWFVFNIADIFITLGVIFMILLELVDNNKNRDYEKT